MAGQQRKTPMISKWPKGLIGPFNVAYPNAQDFEHVKKHPWLCVTYDILDSVRGTSDRFIYNTKHKEWAEKICKILNDAWETNDDGGETENP